MTLTERRDLVAQVEVLLRPDKGPQALSNFLSGIHASDLAELLSELEAADAVRVFSALRPGLAAEVLDELDSETAGLLIDRLPAALIRQLLERLPMDDAAEVLAETSQGQAAELLQELSLDAPQEAAELRTLLTYKEKTAGRLMVSNFFSLSPQESAGEALRKAGARAGSFETIYTAYVVQPFMGGQRLCGVLSLRELLAADPAATVFDLMNSEPVSVDVDTDQAEVAKLISKYDLLAVPVLDRGGALVGIVTVDDALDIMVDEFQEQMNRITGSDAARMARRTPWQAARMRLPWLLGTLVIELCSGFVISRFSWVLKEVILLASFMPVISAVSGNTGLQSAAIAVRGLETGHVTRIRKVLPKEMLTSLIIAACVGLVAGTVGAIWSRHLPFGIVIGGGMFVSMQIAGLMGTAIPIVSKRLGFDPASTAGPFETAFQDVIGFAVFLWLASLCLPWLK